MKVVFPGSFDPFTIAHCDIVNRLESIGYEVIVLVLKNKSKKGMYSVQKRCEIIADSLENITIQSYDGLLSTYCDENNINVIARGIRGLKDYEYEKDMEINNKKLNSNIEYIFLNTDPKYVHVSSTVVRELISYKEDVKHLVRSELVYE